MRRRSHLRLGPFGWLLAISPFIDVASATHAQASEWVWPLDPKPAVLRTFQPPPQPWLAGHRGIDLAARVGQRVRASGAGVVTFAGLVASLPVVTVSHGVLRTTYGPVEPAVRSGDRVRAGDPIGRLGRAGAHCGALRPCLHWGLLRGDTYLDPLALFRPRPIRLLPRDAGTSGASTGAAHRAERDRPAPSSIQGPEGLGRGRAAIIAGAGVALGALTVAARRRRPEPAVVPNRSGR